MVREGSYIPLSYSFSQHCYELKRQGQSVYAMELVVEALDKNVDRCIGRGIDKERRHWV